MRILHTGDWHLGDRTGSRDRTRDLRRNLERIAAYCVDERVDVLAVAGDLFSDKLRHQDDLSHTIEHLSKTFRPFLQGGGTILAVTGNHDKEIPCQTLKTTLTLADPRDFAAGETIGPGRLYLATAPTFYSLPDREGRVVQFVMMPYPMPSRYFDGTGGELTTREQVNRRLQTEYTKKLDQITTNKKFHHDRPSVLLAHIHVRAQESHKLYYLTEADDVIFSADNLPNFAYVALGHIHRAQALNGRENLRYCGSLDRLDMDERDYSPGVVIVDIDSSNLAQNIRTLPLEATPFYDVTIDNPEVDLPQLRQRYPDADRALVKYRLWWKPGQHDREALLREVHKVFPNWYDHEIHEVGRTIEASRHASLPSEPTGPEATVLHFLEQEFDRNNDPDEDRAEMLAIVRALLAES